MSKTHEKSLQQENKYRRDTSLLLVDILLIASGAALSGAATFVEMESSGRKKPDWLRSCLGLQPPHGIATKLD